MRLYNKVAIAFLISLLGASRGGQAAEILAPSLSQDELAHSVTGASIVVAWEAARTPSGGLEIALQDFTGMQTVSSNTGSGSVAQATTSLALRATLLVGPAVKSAPTVQAGLHFEQSSFH